MASGQPSLSALVASLPASDVRALLLDAARVYPGVGARIRLAAGTVDVDGDGMGDTDDEVDAMAKLAIKPKAFEPRLRFDKPQDPFHDNHNGQGSAPHHPHPPPQFPMVPAPPTPPASFTSPASPTSTIPPSPCTPHTSHTPHTPHTPATPGSPASRSRGSLHSRGSRTSLAVGPPPSRFDAYAREAAHALTTQFAHLSPRQQRDMGYELAFELEDMFGAISRAVAAAKAAGGSDGARARADAVETMLRILNSIVACQAQIGAQARSSALLVRKFIGVLKGMPAEQVRALGFAERVRALHAAAHEQRILSALKDAVKVVA